MVLYDLLAGRWLNITEMIREECVFMNDILVTNAIAETFVIEFSSLGFIKFDQYVSDLNMENRQLYEDLNKQHSSIVDIVHSELGRFCFNNGFVLLVNQTFYLCYNNKSYEFASNWKSE